ncbi:hypothetical protein BE11_21555 [Sorangium cellulosum]|nr:hypothetical protein BE11_21555 [Sorangium cellulosum]
MVRRRWPGSALAGPCAGGFFPAAELGAAYLSTQHVAVVATCGVRFIRTLAWSGVSVEPAAAGRIFW